ncbi:MAG: hypothetical protein ACJAVR_002915 [Paracoccaceae bacterium]
MKAWQKSSGILADGLSAPFMQICCIGAMEITIRGHDGSHAKKWHCAACTKPVQKKAHRRPSKLSTNRLGLPTLIAHPASD